MKIIQDFIPIGRSNRPQTRLHPRYITVHETDNPNVGANALAHARYVKGSDAIRRAVSWHYTVDDTYIIQHLPHNEVGWHAGKKGNAVSIGIELCVNKDGNFEQTVKNAQWLILKLMNELNIPIDRVVPHRFWTNKNCPRTLLPVFNEFKQGVIRLAKEKEPSPWAKSSWEKAVKANVLDGTNPKDPVTREQLAVILDRLGMLTRS